MVKAALELISSDLLEQIYREVEDRIERKFASRIRELETKLARSQEESEAWRKRYFREQQRAEKLQGQLELAQKKIKELEALAERQRARIEALEAQIHGKKSEATTKPAPATEPESKRQRGRQSGTKGFGRKRRDSVEPVDCNHDFAEQERVCPKCGRPFEDIGEKVSEEIHVEYKLVRRVHRRKVIRKTCECPGVPKVKAAPAPPKLFKGSLLSTDTWSFIIYDKYWLQRPLNRTRQLLDSLGLSLSQGMITNGLKRLHDREVFKPLVDDIRQRVSASAHQQKDETGWKVFEEVEGKTGYQCYLWVTLGDNCTYFQIDPHRSRQVALQTIGTDPVVLSTDCLSSYHNMGDHVTNAWCWAHIRRSLLELSRHKGLHALSQAWVKRVDQLFHLNNARLSANSDHFAVHHYELTVAVAEFERQSKRNAKRNMHPQALKVFKSIAKHWDGLTVFVRMPGIPMDNNASERALRNNIVGRKCYYGSGSLWSAALAADLFTIFATLEQNGINVRTWLAEYLHAVAKNGGRAPANATSFLPWNSPSATDLLS